MSRKTIAIIAGVVLVLSVCVIGGVMLAMPRVSYALQAFTQGAPTPGYGPGVGPGAGMTPGAGMGQGGGPGMMGGRGGMMGRHGGTPFAPEGATPPAGGVGGLVAVSADGKTITPAADAPKLPENTAAQKVGDMNVTLALSPYPPVSFQKGQFDVTLTDAQGQAITDAQIAIDLTMPGMPMPPSKPEAQHLGNGKYQASAFWTMRGLWRMEVIINRGGQTQSAFFDVWL